MHDPSDTSIPFPDVWELMESLIFWAILLREDEKNETD